MFRRFLWCFHPIHIITICNFCNNAVLLQGITPVLPIFREGILTGSPEIKELSAIALGELIRKTSAEALKPSVVHITGPLIRILGDRFAPAVKTAVLETLTLLLSKVVFLIYVYVIMMYKDMLNRTNHYKWPNIWNRYCLSHWLLNCFLL